MNEFFLVSIVLLTYFIQGNDRAPAIAYCFIAGSFLMLSYLIIDSSTLFFIGLFGDVLTLSALVCFSGCLRSKLTYFLIPLSIVSILMHFQGWAIHHQNADPALFNNTVVIYMFTIIALFAWRASKYGDNFRSIRFLRGDSGGSKSVGLVSK